MDTILITGYPDSKAKEDILRNQIKNVRESVSLPIIVGSHLPLPEDIVRQCDYFYYDRNNGLSENYFLNYHYRIPGYVKLRTARGAPYHSLACLRSIKNGAMFLRGKYENIHFFEYDATMNFPGYINFTTPLLERSSFVGIEYFIPRQNLNGIIMNFCSFNAGWFDDNIPEISSWAGFAALARDKWDNLMFENWMHNYFEDHSLLKDCTLLSHGELDQYVINLNDETLGGEPGLRVRLSEMEDHKLIMFIHLYEGNKKRLDLIINRDGVEKELPLYDGTIYWEVLEKSGIVSVRSKEQFQEFVIDPNKEYLNTVFKFDDDRLKCLSQEEF
jgi:hypothetical protein